MHRPIDDEDDKSLMQTHVHDEWPRSVIGAIVIGAMKNYIGDETLLGQRKSLLNGVSF